MHCVLGVPCTLIDPVQRRSLLTSRQRRWLRKQGGTCFGHHAAEFGPAFGGEGRPEEAALLEGCSLLVGLHPDEATEPIVDAAVRLKKPFAVVPCCVFPNLFPGRRLPDGTAVTTTAQFVEYLAAKVDGARVAALPFEGANTVVYRM